MIFYIFITLLIFGLFIINKEGKKWINTLNVIVAKSIFFILV